MSESLVNSATAALLQLNQPDSTTEKRREAEAWLLSFRASHDAWSTCIALLDHREPQVQLFAAQTLRHKLRKQGKVLSLDQCQQLRSVLTHHLSQPGPTAFIRHLCLALCALAASDEQWQDVIGYISSQLPSPHQIICLQLLAEDGSSDWRNAPVNSGKPVASNPHMSACMQCGGFLAAANGFSTGFQNRNEQQYPWTTSQLLPMS